MARNRAPTVPSTGDYPVGYCKPPAHSRFQPGQSGNPRGRPKAESNLATLVAKALTEKVVVNEGGRRRKITKVEAIAKQLVNKATGGDLRAIRELQAFARAADFELARLRENAGGGDEILKSEQPQFDFAEMSTRELEVLWEAAKILEGKKQPPDCPMPPPDPGEA